MVSIKRERLPAVRDILKPGLAQNNYKMLQIDPTPPPGWCCKCVYACVRSPVSPYVGRELRTRVPLLTLLLRLMFYLILSNCWWAKAAGTLKQYAALNKNHFEQCNGNDSSLIIFEYLTLKQWCVQLTVLTKRAKTDLLTQIYKNTQGGGMICSQY